MKNKNLFMTGMRHVLYFPRIWWRLGRRIPPWTYLYRCFIFQTRMRRVPHTRHGTRLIGPAEAAGIPDNSRDYDHITYSYRGLKEVKAMIADGTPLVFITWHQGASGRNYGIARVLPETAIFTRATFQYGKVFSHSMLRAKGLSLVKIERFLREGRPVKYTIDGVPLGQTVRLPMFGIPCDFATAPIQIMRSVAGLRFIPLTAYCRDGNSIELIFHPPYPPPEDLPGMSDREVLEALISYLERDLSEQAPEQVRWRIIAGLEQLANQEQEEQEGSGLDT